MSPKTATNRRILPPISNQGHRYVVSLEVVKVSASSRIECIQPLLFLSIGEVEVDMHKRFLVGLGRNNFSWKPKSSRFIQTGLPMKVVWQPKRFRKQMIEISLSYTDIMATLRGDTGNYEYKHDGATIRVFFRKHSIFASVIDIGNGQDKSFDPDSQNQGFNSAESDIATSEDAPNISLSVAPDSGIPFSDMPQANGSVSHNDATQSAPSGPQSLQHSAREMDGTPSGGATTFVDYSICTGGVFNKVTGDQYNSPTADDYKYLNELNPNYMLNNPQRCLDGTRQDIVVQIADWANDANLPNILWLHAYPGTGKSTIASTIAQQLGDAGRLGAIFAFKARSGTRSSILWRLVSYELARKFAVCRKDIIGKLKNREIRLANATPKEIFAQFVEEPLHKLAESSPPTGCLPVFVIDGLDEYSNVEGPYHEIHSCIESWARLPIPLKLVVTSRVEDRIRASFRNTPHHALAIGAGDDVSVQSTNDIRMLLMHEFMSISNEFELPEAWPGVEVVEGLTRRAGGLFIWAVTALKYIAVNPSSPRLLDMQSESFSPGDLYGLYKQILEKSFGCWREHECSSFRSFVTAVSATRLQLVQSDLEFILDHTTALAISKGLRPVLKEGSIVQFAHQSFVDFLQGFGDDDSAFPSPNNFTCPDRFRVNHSEILPILNKFASIFTARFEEIGDLSDLENIVLAERQILELLPSDDAATPVALTNLGRSLCHRFRKLGHVVDIDESIVLHLHANEHTSDNDPKKSDRLSALAAASKLRFEHLGELNDIDDTIAALRLSIEFDIDNYSVISHYLFELGIAFQLRFQCTLDGSNLDDAIGAFRRAIDLTVDSRRVLYRDHLRNALGIQFEHRGTLRDVKQAIASQARAMEHNPPRGKPPSYTNVGHRVSGPNMPSGSSRRPTSIALGDRRLSVPYSVCTSQSRVVFKPHIDGYTSPARAFSAKADLDTSIALLRLANGHAATRSPVSLNNLAFALFARFQRDGDLLDLQDAVSKFREAADRTGYPLSAWHSQTFAMALNAHFFASHDLNDLDEAISKFRHSVALTPNGHPDFPEYLAHLHDAYTLRHSWT